jgi:hypothetical protein
MLNQILENPNSEYRDVEAGHPRPREWKWYHYAEMVAIAFVFISLFVLFGVVSNQKFTNNNYYTSSVISSTFGSAGSISGISEGKAVSFSSSGNIQAGAGTSVYMNIATVNVDCPSYPALLALTNSAYLLSYADEANEKSTLQLIQVSSTATGMTGSSIKTLASTYYIYDMVLLPNSNGVFVAICQDASVNDETAYVIVGQADANTATITLFDSSAILYATKYSMNPSIVALSSNSFLIGYYNAEPYELALKFGMPFYFMITFVLTHIQTPIL